MGGGPNPLKVVDPLGTPVNTIVLPVQQLKSEQPSVEKPMYAELMRDVQSPPPAAASVHGGGDYAGRGGGGRDELPQPIAQSRRPQPPQSPQHAPVARQMEYDEAEAAYAPPARATYVAPPPPPQSAQPQPKMKKSALSVEAQRNSLVLLSVTALALQFLAPRIRVYPRFTSNSGLGLSYTGVAVVSLAIVLGYKSIVYAAGLSE